MWTMLSRFFAPLATILALIISAIGLYVKGKQNGREEELAANKEETLDDVKKTKKEINRINSDRDAIIDVVRKNCRD
jgi:Mg2+/Co2+ transporter CorB